MYALESHLDRANTILQTDEIRHSSESGRQAPIVYQFDLPGKTIISLADHTWSVMPAAIAGVWEALLSVLCGQAKLYHWKYKPSAKTWLSNF